MIAIDSNVLVRYFVRDDPQQLIIAKRLLENGLSAENPGFVSLVVVAELAWVLRQVYRLTADEIRQIAQRLLNAVEIEIESAKILESALRLEHGDLADSLIHFIGTAAGCDRTVTFDRTFARVEGVELLRR